MGGFKPSFFTKGVMPDSITNPFINSVAANTTLRLRASDVKC